MRPVLFGLAICGTLLTASAAVALTQDEARKLVEACIDARGAEQVAVCDKAIGAGRWAAPVMAHLLTGRGNGHLDQGKLDRALADFDAAIKADPKLDSAHDGRGRALSDKGDKDGAIAAFDTALRLEPNAA